MKRGLLIGILALMILMSISFVVTQENETCDEDCKVNNARSCLENKINDCSSLSVEEEIFSLLAVGKCQSELMSDSSNNECWPKGGCDVKTTAQAILGLRNVGASTNKPKSWLISQNRTTQKIDWYLQIARKIESTETITCTISYDTGNYNINIGEDKKIDKNAGSCLTLAQNDYWLGVSSLCYNKEFTVSCGQAFLTNLLYQKQDSSTIYVSESTKSASANGETTQQVDSFCFGQGSCDYEGSLWASLALDSLEDDVTPYLSYLITMADESINTKYLPEAFLYKLTGDFQTELLDLQRKVNEEYYWEVSGDKFYDTALALLPFQGENPQEKIDSKTWLLEIQETSGCWNLGNIRNTAFILFSLWPKQFVGDGVGDGIDCEDAGYNCISTLSCNNAGGEILEDYYCPGFSICCSEELIQETCSAQGGEICDSNEFCEDGASVDASDLDIGEGCCLGGTCKEVEEGEISECESVGGICRIYECNDNEEESPRSCDSTSQICCVRKSLKGNYTGIIIFSILIFLVVLGIVFRKQLKKLLLKIKSKFGRKGKGLRGPARPYPPGRPPGPRPLGRPPGFPPRRIMPRRMPSAQMRPPGRPRRVGRPAGKPKGELDDVLKKLKEMGK